MIRFIALIVLSACLSTIAVAQETTIRFGTPAIVPVDAFSSSITMGQSLMVLKHGKKSYSIDQYSLADLALQKSTPFTGSVKRENAETAIASSPLKIVKLNNEAYLVSVSGGKGSFVFWLQKITDSGELSGELIEIGSATLLDINQTPFFDIETSPDGSKLGIATPITLANTNNCLKLFWVYDLDTQKSQSIAMSVPVMNRYFNAMKYSLTNNGEFIVLTQRLLLTDELQKGTSRNDFRFYLLNAKTQETKEIPLAFNNRNITTVNYRVDGEKNTIVCGGLSSTIDNRYDGDNADNWFWATIDLSNASSILAEFALSAQLIAETNDKKPSKLIKGEGISNAFKLIDMLFFEDGSRSLVFERFFSSTQSVYASSQPASNKVVATDHYYKSILVMRVDAANQLMSYAVVPKDQFSRDDRAYAYSTIPYQQGNDILLFFNDHLDNTSVKPDAKHNIDRLEDPTKSGLFCVKVNKEGNTSKKLVYNNRDNCKTIMPPYVFVNNTNNLIGLYTTSTNVKSWIPENNLGLYRIEVKP